MKPTSCRVALVVAALLLNAPTVFAMGGPGHGFGGGGFRNGFGGGFRSGFDGGFDHRGFRDNRFFFHGNRLFFGFGFPGFGFGGYPYPYYPYYPPYYPYYPYYPPYSPYAAYPSPYPAYPSAYSGTVTPRSTTGVDPATVLVQAELQRRGYEVGPIDGLLGPQTKAAISEYEQQNGLPVDGFPSPTLRQHLQSHPTGAG